MAALAGVSPAAVSKTFNGTGSISAATEARIREAARKLHWTPSASAVALRRARSQTVGLVLNRQSSSSSLSATSADLITGLESVLAEHDYGLLLHLFTREGGEEATVYRKLSDSRRVDGVVLTDSTIGDQRYGLMRELGLPAVLVGVPWGDDPIPHLPSEGDGGIDEVAQHLLSLGHHRIAYVGGPAERVQATIRRTAFERTLREAGADPRPVLSAASYSAAESAALTRSVLAAEDRPTAVVYGNDVMAIAGMRVAREAGLRVPEDLSIVGYEGSVFSEWTEPQLTTVQRNVVQRGRAAAAILLQQLGEKDVAPVELVPPHLVVRGSTAPRG
ncbi:LacI family DNA-binding transcriptional regulator [Phycicoccus sp. BSK3Z-2]|uniref:LacI family DNA-binding transcriptional regulator n=1 Tax=Phycicoccus avicenniae TaxID=2828860 RepID=A0A941DBT9_9MICO|nr:LacI family DNA-binding transcriptional regulator [Phycicoccus avicenniae]MBR7744798.1 LacI family DNA-binding transcriptional regulator [Phycicoccus avicenniae]